MTGWSGNYEMRQIKALKGLKGLNKREASNKHPLGRLAVELGSVVDDEASNEAYGWAWKPYGWFDPARRPREIIHTYIYGRRPRVWRTP